MVGAITANTFLREVFILLRVALLALAVRTEVLPASLLATRQRAVIVELSVPKCLEGEKIRVETTGNVGGGVLSAGGGSGIEYSSSVLCSYGLEVVRWWKKYADMRLTVTYGPRQEGGQKFDEIVRVPLTGAREYRYQNGIEIKVSMK